MKIKSARARRTTTRHHSRPQPYIQPANRATRRLTVPSSNDLLECHSPPIVACTPQHHGVFEKEPPSFLFFSMYTSPCRTEGFSAPEQHTPADCTQKATHHASSAPYYSSTQPLAPTHLSLCCPLSYSIKPNITSWPTPSHHHIKQNVQRQEQNVVTHNIRQQNNNRTRNAANEYQK
eukprot:gene9414-6612_t